MCLLGYANPTTTLSRREVDLDALRAKVADQMTSEGASRAIRLEAQ
jgi:hypothetical protein